jgi:hypothetical protein
VVIDRESQRSLVACGQISLLHLSAIHGRCRAKFKKSGLRKEILFVEKLSHSQLNFLQSSLLDIKFYKTNRRRSLPVDDTIFL